MPLSKLAVSKKFVGLRQVYRALQAGRIENFFLAKDVHKPEITLVVEECKRQGLEIEWVENAIMLGRACLIERGAAAAGTEKISGAEF